MSDVAERHELPPMRGRKLVLATIAVALSGFMVILDTTICNVSVPTIAGNLAVSPSQGTWVVTSYSVADAIIVPLTGWLVARLGTVRLFVSALFGFMLMSLACGFSQSLPMLVGFRILQGIAGAPLLALSQTLLFNTYPREKIAVGQAVFGMTAILGPILGPILGGYISDNLSWPWIFFINVPIGLMAAAAVWHLYKDRETPTRRDPVDKIGLALLILSVGALQLMLDKGKELDWFDSPFIVTLALIAAVGLVVLVVWELGEQNPIVNLRLFADRNYAIGCATQSVLFGIFFGSVVLIPQWLQSFMGFSAFDAGLAAAPNGVLAVLLAPVIAKLVNRVDVRIFVTCAILIFCGTFWMRAHWTTQVTFAGVAWPQFIQGLAMACFFMPLSQLTIGGLRQDQIAMGAGLSNFCRTASAAFAASLAMTSWDNQITRHHAQLVDNVTRDSTATQSMLDTFSNMGMSSLQSLAQLDRTVMREAAMLATRDYFAWTIPMFCLLLIVIWRARPVKVDMRRNMAH